MGPNLDAMNLMVNISANYPLLYNFTLLLSAFLGFCMGMWVLVMLVQAYVTQTIPKEKFNWGLAAPAMLISSSMMALTTTLFMVSASILDVGGGSLFPPVAITGGLTPDKMLGMFAEQTVRFLGVIFGLWGLVEMFMSRTPDGDRTKIWSGVIRLCVGGALVRAREFGNLFGGMGDVFFR